MVGPVLAALIAAFLGSSIGAWAALSRFKRERSFDRQVDWYERAVRALIDLSQRIEVAITHHEEDRNSDVIEVSWREVQKAHLTVDRLTIEANIYGSALAVSTLLAINKQVQDVAEETNAFDPDSLAPEQRLAALKRIDSLPEPLLAAAHPLAVEARRHLRIS